MKETHHGEGSHPQADPLVGQKRRLLLPAARSLPQRPEAHRQQERVEGRHHHHACYVESHRDPAVDGEPEQSVLYPRLTQLLSSCEAVCSGSWAVLDLIRRAESSRALHLVRCTIKH